MSSDLMSGYGHDEDRVQLPGGAPGDGRNRLLHAARECVEERTHHRDRVPVVDPGQEPPSVLDDGPERVRVLVPVRVRERDPPPGCNLEVHRVRGCDLTHDPVPHHVHSHDPGQGLDRSHGHDYDLVRGNDLRPHLARVLLVMLKADTLVIASRSGLLHLRHGPIRM